MGDGHHADATNTDAPDDDAPGVRSVFHGLRTGPAGGARRTALKPNSGIRVLPSGINPVDR